MPHWRANHDSNSKMLTSADLFDEKASEQKGTSVYKKMVVQIARMTVEQIKTAEKPGGDRRNVAYFKGFTKGLGLNATNAKTLEALSGNGDPRSWVGMKVGLYVDPSAKYPGKNKTGPALRISSKRLDPSLPVASQPEVNEETRERLEAEKEKLLEEGFEEEADAAREPGSDDR